MRIPRHIGVIPDGNRRWATLRQMEKKDGYQYGLEPGMKLLKKAKEYGVEELTYYGFTMDNCKRPKEQFEAFQSACVEAVQMLTREGADLLVIGNEKSKCFPKELEYFRVRTPVHGGGMRVNFLVNYGWEWDLSHIAESGQPYSCDISRIDMIIRWAVCAGCQVFFRCSRFMRIFMWRNISGRTIRMRILNRHWSGTTDRMLL